MIAFRVYGSETSFPLLMDANQAQARIVIFDAGVILAVPDLPENVSNDLPPWKR